MIDDCLFLNFFKLLRRKNIITFDSVQVEDNLPSLFFSPLQHKPPRTFRGEERNHHQQRRPRKVHAQGASPLRRRVHRIGKAHAGPRRNRVPGSDEDRIQADKEAAILWRRQLGAVYRGQHEIPERAHPGEEAAAEEHFDIPGADDERAAEQADSRVVVDACFAAPAVEDDSCEDDIERGAGLEDTRYSACGVE